ncbi:hypothetical protein IW140_006050 [Coemansia sp. RSA 1813]|nr:hypothetical protein EV178_006020 [Coemansia sp. RSA 1646]KAJ1767134.1 hypothetical protein LPJ74_005533 [Coemansia sp. RSA 1843]KAJ2085966.1 hypothetical protein IW138_005995 [Coemansia sp. RSA 986]KAJ2210755.1 hypothetical protein EV179_006015 [Coemansia sp. RSA 487]KAJ2563589.1 hypothetical protein IW140_006050 [Coemansia sp. RSA 1813]
MSATATSVSPSVLRSLKIKTGAVKRLVKEREVYFFEADKQRERIEKLRLKEGVHEADIRKQKEVLEETLEMIPHMERHIRKAMEDLDNIVSSLTTEENETQEITDTRDAIQSAKEALKEAATQEKASATPQEGSSVEQ